MPSLVIGNTSVTRPGSGGHNNCVQKISLTITGSLERFFYFWGYQIGLHPWRFILACTIVPIVCGVGLFRFKYEARPDKLWIPKNSEFLRDSNWLKDNFPSPVRFHHAIVTADDVLQPDFLALLARIHIAVRHAKTPANVTFDKVCFRLPVTKFSLKNERRKRWIDDEDDFDFDDPFFQDNTTEVPQNPTKNKGPPDPSIDFPLTLYCDFINVLDDACWETNPAELWNFDPAVISNLTKEDILRVVNGRPISPVFGRPINYTTELGGIVKNKTGYIVSANSVLIRWFGKINYTDLTAEIDQGTGETVDKDNLNWEKEFIKTLTHYPLPNGTRLYFRSARSFGDISNSTIWSDANMLAIGFTIVFVYVILMLGKCNFVEQRPFLSLAGLICIGFAIPVTYGICSALGLSYGPVHNILPFLLLGIGIDDMFVIMESWNNLPDSVRKRPLPERIGLALKHAGVSVTITSITDFVAFVIGSTTVLPGLQSFCIYAALGIVATYIFQATFFTAWLSFDVRRIESKRNALVPCYKHAEDYTPNSCSQQSIAKTILGGIYSDILLSKPIKVFVLGITAVTAGFAIYGNTQLRQEFDPMWFLPQDSHMFQYWRARDKYFPGMGYEGMVIFGNVSLTSRLTELEHLINTLESAGPVYDVDAWYPLFKEYGNTYFNLDIPKSNLTQKVFDKYLSRFLFSPSGSRFRGRFRFDGNLTCGLPAPKVLVSMFTFKFKMFTGPEEHIPAMHQMKKLVNQHFPESSSKVFIWTFAFATWETDEIITAELYRNMALAMVCVLFTTLLLIANVKTCLMVLLCVILTLLDVLGGMYFWNLTIDTVSCVDLVLAIGLCVDYAAHIGHTFMTIAGSRDERTRTTLKNIGPAVLNGGISTFLAFVLLANSKSHVFLTFYKVFFLVVSFGLYHGLVLLPVLLSIVGPPPYASAGIESPRIHYRTATTSEHEAEDEVTMSLNGGHTA